MLFDDFMQPCTLVEKLRAPDGEGGFVTQWQDGAQFMAAITLDSTMQAQIAQAQGVTSVYTITTHRNVSLDYHDVIRDASGNIFRVTSEGGVKQSPKSASLDMMQVSAEKWRLTT